MDEFAKHPNTRLLWETAQARVTWGYDLAVWSSHDGEDTLFNEFARQARSECGVRNVECGAVQMRSAERATQHGGRGELSLITNRESQIADPNAPWNLYFKVTMVDAIELGLLRTINRVHGARFTP